LTKSVKGEWKGGRSVGINKEDSGGNGKNLSGKKSGEGRAKKKKKAAGDKQSTRGERGAKGGKPKQHTKRKKTKLEKEEKGVKKVQKT